MGKYSENPIDNLEGYLDNIEMIVEKMEKRQKEHTEAAPPSSDGSDLKAVRAGISAIKAAIKEIKKDNDLVSASMNTIAEAIGTVPTEEERERQRREDQVFVVNYIKEYFEKKMIHVAQLPDTQIREIRAFLNGLDKLGEKIPKEIPVKIDQNAKYQLENMGQKIDHFREAMSDGKWFRWGITLLFGIVGGIGIYSSFSFGEKTEELNSKIAFYQEQLNIASKSYDFEQYFKEKFPDNYQKIKGAYNIENR